MCFPQCQVAPCRARIAILYVAVIFLTFKPLGAAYIFEQIALWLIVLGGLASSLHGYVSVVMQGGEYSLEFIEFTSRLNGSSHALEV